MKKILCLVTFLAIVLVLNGCATNCGMDLNCFEESSRTCSNARVNIEQEGSILKLTLLGKTSDNLCKVAIKIEKVGEALKQQYPEESKMLEGKTSTCIFQMGEEQVYSQLQNIKENVDKSCSGPIKEVMKRQVGDAIQEQLK